MKNIFLLMTILLIFSCNKNELDLLKIKNINEIVETVIKEDSLKVLKNENLDKLLCDSLRNIQIYIPSKSDAKNSVPPPPPSFTSIERLINSKINGKIFFSSKDSLYIINQNSDSKKIRIDENILKKINSTTTEKEILKANSGKEYNIYEISKPIFSLDNKRAYLELNHYCGHLCGSGKAIFLQKIDGKWKILEQYQTWVS
jgi:hypothetical protein